MGPVFCAWEGRAEQVARKEGVHVVFVEEGGGWDGARGDGSVLDAPGADGKAFGKDGQVETLRKHRCGSKQGGWWVPSCGHNTSIRNDGCGQENLRVDRTSSVSHLEAFLEPPLRMERCLHLQCCMAPSPWTVFLRHRTRGVGDCPCFGAMDVPRICPLRIHPFRASSTPGNTRKTGPVPGPWSLDTRASTRWASTAKPPPSKCGCVFHPSNLDRPFVHSPSPFSQGCVSGTSSTHPTGWFPHLGSIDRGDDPNRRVARGGVLGLWMWIDTIDGSRVETQQEETRVCGAISQRKRHVAA